jgi:transposase InsO family protein
MPWKESAPVNERMKFVVRLEAGERMTDLCREFGISRKTGYRFWNRYKEHGPEALFDASRRPKSSPWRTSREMREVVVQARKDHPTWGPRKLRAWLEQRHPGVKLPGQTAIYGILKSEGLVLVKKRKRRVMPHTEPLRDAKAPNDLWCADHKGQFRLGNGKYSYPLTISDAHSRFLVACEGMENTREAGAMAVFRQAFREHGLPRAIRTDDGTPFATKTVCGLSRLSFWWRRLGISHERIEPGHPEQNGRHERMHLTSKLDTTRPAGQNLLQQQERFDDFRQLFNTERPHEALGDRPPTSVHKLSSRPFPERLAPLKYLLHDLALRVSTEGHIRFPGPKKNPCLVYISVTPAGEHLGLREVDPNRWLVSFMDLELGLVDTKARRLQPS